MFFLLLLARGRDRLETNRPVQGSVLSVSPYLLLLARGRDRLETVVAASVAPKL